MEKIATGSYTFENQKILRRKTMRTCQLLAMALAGLSFAAWATPSLRIMPLGDSITQGAKSENTAGYRGPLWTLLKEAGYNVD